MQIYNQDFHFKGRSKSYCASFSPNPDNRSKYEISPEKRKIRDREKTHIENRGEKLENPNEATISFKLERKKECSCRGTNVNCYKCNRTGFIEISHETPLLEEPVQNTNFCKSYMTKKPKIINLSSKATVHKTSYKCPYCEREYEQESYLKTHIDNIHKKTKKYDKSIKSKKFSTSKKSKWKSIDKIIGEKSSDEKTYIQFEKKDIDKNHMSTKKDFKVSNGGNIQNTIESLASKGWNIKL